MKGLLIKDLYILRRQFSLYFIIVLIFTFVTSVVSLNSESSGLQLSLLYSGLISGMMPISIIQFEERQKWGLYVGTLPCKRSTVVAEKYILLIMIIVFFSFVNILGFIISSIIYTVKLNFNMIISSISILTALAAIPASIEIPICIKFGSDKSRIILFITIGIIAAILGFIFSITETSPVFKEAASLSLPIMIFFICALLLVISYLISARIYQNKDLK